MQCDMSSFFFFEGVTCLVSMPRMDYFFNVILKFQKYIYQLKNMVYFNQRLQFREFPYSFIK